MLHDAPQPDEMIVERRRLTKLRAEYDHPVFDARERKLGLNDVSIRTSILDSECDLRHECLTLDMSGGWKRAKHAGRRPLDGRVRRFARSKVGPSEHLRRTLQMSMSGKLLPRSISPSTRSSPIFDCNG